MTRARENRLYRQFRRTRSPRPLARLFDLTHRELYRVALHLSRDPHKAEDLLQTTYLVAIEDAEGFREDRDVLPWLLGILANRARSWKAAQKRERTKAAPQPHPSRDPGELAGEREMQETLHRSVRSLPEPYRSVLILHLEHGLGGVEIGDALDRPANTVRSQIQRGMDLLRKTLPAGLGAAGFLAGAPALGRVRETILHRIAGPEMSTLGSILIMKKATAFTALALVALALAWTLLLHEPQAPVPDVAAVEDKAVSTDQETVERASPEVVAAERGAVSGNVTAETSEGLRVTVRWSDGEPAPDVQVRLYEGDDEPFPRERSGSTTGDGQVLFRNLPRGELTVVADRSQAEQVSYSGGLQDLELTVPLGIRVRGTLTDQDRRPLPGGRIWISAGPHTVDPGWFVAIAAVDGSFEVRDIKFGRMISAIAEGHAPARAQQISGQAGETVEIHISLTRTAGLMEGVVYGPDGRPAVDAAILLGWTYPVVWNDGRLLVRPARELRTDKEGRFRADALGEHEIPVWARAPDTAAWVGRAHLRAQETTPMEIHLQKGAEVSGSVLRPDGAPAPGIRVTGLQDEVEPEAGHAYQGPSWARAWTATDSRGRFRLSHLRPGEVLLEAGNEEARVSRKMELRDEERVEWNPVLGVGLSISGRVVDEAGRGLSGLSIRVQSESRDHGRTAETDASGFFEVDRLDPDTYTLHVHDEGSGMGSMAVMRGIRAGGEPLWIEIPAGRMASARVRGRLSGPSGQPVSGAIVSLILLHPDGRRESAHEFTGNDGAFLTRLLPPGRYAISTRSADHGILGLPERYLAPDQTLDLGEHRFRAPGSLELRLSDESGRPVRYATVYVSSAAEPWSRGATVENGILVREAMQPGRYLLSSDGAGLPVFALEVEIRPGERTEAELRLPAAVRRRLLFPATGRGTVVRQVWKGPGGLVFADFTKSGTEQPFEVEMLVPPGTYTVEVIDSSGERTERTLIIDGAVASDEVLPLR